MGQGRIRSALAEWRNRGLKPANIKITPEGVMKVLDFGLAQALAPDPESAAARDLASSPTVTVGGPRTA